MSGVRTSLWIYDIWHFIKLLWRVVLGVSASSWWLCNMLLAWQNSSVVISPTARTAVVVGNRPMRMCVDLPRVALPANLLLVCRDSVACASVRHLLVVWCVDLSLLYTAICNCVCHASAAMLSSPRICGYYRISCWACVCVNCKCM